MNNEIEFIPEFEVEGIDTTAEEMDTIVTRALDNPNMDSWEKEARSLRCIIVDIDGTLANVDHRLHHVTGMKADWDSFFDEMGKDTTYEEIVRLVQIYHKTGFVVFLVTARPSKYRAETEAWLNINAVPHDFLLMREDGDFREDTIVKQEILDAEFEDKSLIEFVVDDRPKVCEMWRRNGLRVLAANPHKEREYKELN